MRIEFLSIDQVNTARLSTDSLRKIALETADAEAYHARIAGKPHVVEAVFLQQPNRTAVTVNGSVHWVESGPLLWGADAVEDAIREVSAL